MEFLDGTWKKEVTSWEALLGEELLDQEVVLEGAVHSIRNMGDVAFVILRRREGLFQTVFENEKANLSIHDLKEAMTLRVKGILNAEERAPHGREIRIREIEILSQPAEPMPLAIDKWKLNTSLEAKLNLRPIALRNIQERAKFKIQEASDTWLSVITSMRTVSQRSTHRRSGQEEPRVEQTFSNSATSTNRRSSHRARSSTNR